MNPIFKFAIREDLKDTGDMFLPKKGEPYATGYDVRAAMENREDLVIRPGAYFKIPLGFRAIPEEGWWYELHPRSSSFVKKNMHNLIGIIDTHYPNELIFAGQYIPGTNCLNPDLTVKFGDAIGQIIPIKRVDMGVMSISNEEYDQICKNRVSYRVGGIGSTNNGVINKVESKEDRVKIYNDILEAVK